MLFWFCSWLYVKTIYEIFDHRERFSHLLYSFDFEIRFLGFKLLKVVSLLYPLPSLGLLLLWVLDVSAKNLLLLNKSTNLQSSTSLQRRLWLLNPKYSALVPNRC